jgi:hypothetical protein
MAGLEEGRVAGAAADPAHPAASVTPAATTNQPSILTFTRLRRHERRNGSGARRGAHPVTANPAGDPARLCRGDHRHTQPTCEFSGKQENGPLVNPLKGVGIRALAIYSSI